MQVRFSGIIDLPEERRKIFKSSELNYLMVEDNFLKVFLIREFVDKEFVVDEETGNILKIRQVMDRATGNMVVENTFIERYKITVYRKNYSLNSKKMFIDRDKILFFSEDEKRWVRVNPKNILQVEFSHLETVEVY